MVGSLHIRLVYYISGYYRKNEALVEKLNLPNGGWEALP